MVIALFAHFKEYHRNHRNFKRETHVTIFTNIQRSGHSGRVHTTPVELENACSFISTVRPTVRTGPSRKRNYSKKLFKPEEFENPGFSLLCGRTENIIEAFRKRWYRGNDAISLTNFSSNTIPKWPVIVAFLNSSSVVWTEIIWCVFRVRPPFSNFSGIVWTGSQRSNDWALREHARD